MAGFITIKISVIISEGLINSCFSFIVTFITRFTGLLKKGITIFFSFIFIAFKINVILKESRVDY